MAHVVDAVHADDVSIGKNPLAINRNDPPPSSIVSPTDALSSNSQPPAAATVDPLNERERRLAAKAREIAAKQHRVEDLEYSNLRNDPNRPTWPPCCPVIRHVPVLDIPEDDRSVASASFLLWGLFTLALFWNIVAIFACAVDSVGDSLSRWMAFGLSLVYLGGVSSLYFLLVYRNTYGGLRHRSYTKLWLSMAFTILFELFIIAIIVGVQQAGMAGLVTIASNSLTTDHKVVTALVAVNVVLWSLLAIAFVVFWVKIRSRYRIITTNKK